MKREVYVSENLKRSNIFGSDGSKPAVILATDHRYFGMHRGTENFGEVLPNVIPEVDVLMTSQGVLRCYRAIREAAKRGDMSKPVVLRVSGCTSIRDIPRSEYEVQLMKAAYRSNTGNKFDDDHAEAVRGGDGIEILGELNRLLFEEDTMADERLIVTAEEAGNMGANATAVSIYVGTRYQGQTLQNLAIAAREARSARVPVLGVVAVGKELGTLSENAEFLAQSACLAVEHGADFVKTYHPEKNFDKILAVCPVPVVAAGGKAPKGSAEEQIRSTLDLAAKVMEEGAQGIDFGRRVWRDSKPKAMARALGAVVRDGKSATDALSIYNSD